jgi:hypothetical protein
MTKEVKPNEVEAKEVEIIGLNDYAIIKSFECLGDDKQKREHILEKAIELTSKQITEKNKNAMAKVLKNLVKHKYIKRVSHGIYKLNPAFKFVPRGLALTIEKDCSESVLDQKPESENTEILVDQKPQFRSSEIPPERRVAHTADLKAAIKWWRDYFPKPPGSRYSSNFFATVEHCEKHSLYPDLSNHLPQSGFDVCRRWDQYKNEVKELDNAKKDLLSALEKAVSDIFADLQLNFVEYYDMSESFDSYPSRLNDFDSSLPSLVFDHLLFCLDIDIDRLNSAETEKKYMEILSDEMEGYNIWYRREERIKILPILEDGDSAIWGEDGYIELIRVPKGHSSSLIQGKENALSLLLDGPDATINNKAKYIIDKTQFLEKERYDLIQELDRSLYSKCFSGDCKYLGA